MRGGMGRWVFGMIRIGGTGAKMISQIVGQGGPSNDEFAAIWTSIASKYADSEKIIFGV